VVGVDLARRAVELDEVDRLERLRRERSFQARNASRL
jgi:hypothetical protein